VTGAAVDAALERAARARLLALGFTVPHMDTLGEILDLAAVLEHEGPAGVEGEALRDIIRAVADPDTVDAAPAAYSALFDGEAPCAPYEGSYDGDPFRQVRQMSDVAGFYAAFGAEASGPDADRPDHVACELEFLSFLMLRGVAARSSGRDDEAEVCADAEGAFLRDHLGRWLRMFCDRVVVTTDSPLYSALGRLGSVFAQKECARHGVVPVPVPEARRWSVEADELVCGAEMGGAASGCDGCGEGAATMPPVKRRS
jgi:putative dimethyl sulfoxide reductase chaperone